MKIAEARQVLARYEKEDLVRIAAELYKQIPKAKKNDGEIDLDGLLKDSAAWKEAQKSSRSSDKSTKLLNAEEASRLLLSVQNFGQLARSGQYYSSRVVSRKERIGWRFTVMDFLRRIDRAPVGSPGADDALLALKEIFELLCIGSGVYLFRSEEPFSAVNQSFGTILANILLREFYDGITPEHLEKVMRYVIIADCYNYYGLGSGLTHLLPYLKTPYAREIALDIALKMQDEYKTSDFTLFDGKSCADYQKDDTLCRLLGLSYALYRLLGEIDKGISLYMRRFPEKNKEIALYRLLNLLREDQEYDAWLRTYERWAPALKPRDELVERYERYKAGDFSKPMGHCGFFTILEDD